MLKSTGNGGVFVNPQWEDLTGHTHFKFELQCIPAGDHVSPSGGRHVITNADTEIEGWLPADHAIFEGNAPAGAVFGYNLSANGSLNNVWPPIPVNNADVQWDKGLDVDQGYHSIPLGEQGLVVLNRDGIWWMSDCYGDVPWPKDLNTSFSDSLSDSLNECPRDLSMRMLLWFVRSNFMTDGTVVTSLATNDERISITCQSDPTKAADAGALLIALNLSLTAEGDTTEGYLAFKEFNDALEATPGAAAGTARNGAAFFAVCRGKVSEGIDFADKAGRCVVLTGIPYAPKADAKVRIKRSYLDANRNLNNGNGNGNGNLNLSGEEWYSQGAMRAVNQALGRVIRHRDDYGAVVLADER